MQIVGAVINIILDPIFIFGYFGLPAMGTRGAAIATVAGQIIAMLLGLYFNLTKNTDVQFDFKCIKLESYYFKGICTVGIPTIIMQSMSSVMCFGINKLLLDFSTTSTAVFGAYFKLQTFLYLTGNGVVQGMRPLIGYNYGAGESKRVKEIFRSALFLIVIVMVIGTILCMAVPQALIGLFTGNPETIRLGREALRLISIGFIVSSISVTVSGALEGLGKGKESLVISLLRYIVVILPLAFILSRLFEAAGVWHAFWITEFVSAVISWIICKKEIFQ